MTSAKLNFMLAFAAILSPAWLEILKEFSQIAASLMPVFGLALIIMQMIRLGQRDK